LATMKPDVPSRPIHFGAEELYTVHPAPGILKKR
jgi:hypothetical protein